MTDIIPIDDYRTSQNRQEETYEVPRAMCLRTATERSKVSPVETPRIELPLPGPHIAKLFTHKHEE